MVDGGPGSPIGYSFPDQRVANFSFPDGQFKFIFGGSFGFSSDQTGEQVFSPGFHFVFEKEIGFLVMELDWFNGRSSFL